MRRRSDTPPYLIFQLKTKKPEALRPEATPKKEFCREGGQPRVFLKLNPRRIPI
jgi:hypothetical protein